MNAVLGALDSVADRFGPEAMADPVALRAGLRALTVPPTDAEIDALARVAGTDALARMRDALDRGESADEALDAALTAVDGDGGERWAVALLGAARGYLPRSDGDTGGPRTAGPDAAHRRFRRRPVIIASAVLAALAAAAVLVSVVGVGTDPSRADAVAPGAAPRPGPAATAPTTGPAPADPAAPVDPLDAFTDPGLRAFAAPYLRSPDARCEPGIRAVNVQESVSCAPVAGGRVAALFIKWLNPELMRTTRRGYQDGLTADAGTTRWLRWRFVDPAAGTRIGLPAADPGPADGVRVRLVEKDTALLYFDQDATFSSALFGLAEGSGDPYADLDVLRAYWREPR
jgi:hypothetical protein